MQLLGIQIFSIGEMVELANSWSQVARKWKRFVFINAMRLKLFETRYDYLWTFSDNRVDDFRSKTRFSSVIFCPLRIARLRLNRFQFSQVGWKLTNWSKQFISRTGSCRFNCTRIRDENFQFENCSNESAGRGKNVNSRRWRWTSRHDRVETRPRSFRLLPLLLLRNVYLNFTFDEITSNINFHLDIVVISRK